VVSVRTASPEHDAVRAAPHPTDALVQELDMRRSALKTLLGLAIAVSTVAQLGGCGFQLRGQTALPFTAAYVVAPETSNVATALRRSLSSQQKLAQSLDTAPVRITLDKESFSKNILALSSGGKVREYRLEYHIQLTVTNVAGLILVEPTEIHLSNDFSYTDAQVLAKEAEEASLNRSMEQDALRQILRRLSYLKL
jgi:LPS-assembly lipoprotein